MPVITYYVSPCQKRQNIWGEGRGGVEGGVGGGGGGGSGSVMSPNSNYARKHSDPPPPSV